MDPAASPEPDAPKEAPNEPVAPAPQQIVDVVSAPARTPEEDAAAAEAPDHMQPPLPDMPVKLKTPLSSDVKIAIIATVVIVIVLGALATVAFLKQK